MSLLDQVKVICDRLSQHGWKDLFLQHGLDITSGNLKEELLRELPNINRSIDGFEDFALEGKRGIEPHDPAHSLLFHGLASPNIFKKTDGSNLEVFPTLKEIETIENYVYGISPISIPEIRQIANNNQSIGIVVFSSEYRPAPETPHKKHADICFSRTGISRVGTKDLLFDPKLRGFIPFDDDDKNNIRVLPCKFSAYIAIKERGNRNISRPMRFRNNDDQLDFWIPIYKIYEGSECIRGMNLTLRYESFHINEKLKRIHIQLNGAGGWQEPDINNEPFVFTSGIAEFSNDTEFGSGFLVPTIHSNLVEPATYNGQTLTFNVPQNTQTLSSSMLIPPRGNWRQAPEYVHVRHEITSNNTENNLNNNENVVDVIRTGNYRAKHYIDFTGDGWVKAICPELSTEFTTNVLAYSLVTAPDFFPYADQRELMDWWEQEVSPDLRERIWRIPPNTLSDERIAANLQLPGSPFNPDDKTTTAIVSITRANDTQKHQFKYFSYS